MKVSAFVKITMHYLKIWGEADAPLGCVPDQHASWWLSSQQQKMFSILLATISFSSSVGSNVHGQVAGMGALLATVRLFSSTVYSHVYSQIVRMKNRFNTSIYNSFFPSVCLHARGQVAGLAKSFSKLWQH